MRGFQWVRALQRMPGLERARSGFGVTEWLIRSVEVRAHGSAPGGRTGRNAAELVAAASQAVMTSVIQNDDVAHCFSTSVATRVIGARSETLTDREKDVTIMRNSTRFALTTLAAAALFGTAGAVGTSMASADTIENLTPGVNGGAHCVVIDDNGGEEFLYTPYDCSSAQKDVDKEERREERRDERAATECQGFRERGLPHSTDRD